MPFWLFAIIWSILSYVIVLVFASYFGVAGVSNKTEVQVANEFIEPENVSLKGMKTPSTFIESIPKKPSSSDVMKSGYYILDVNETVKKGIPKYIYLGPEAPNLIYHNTVSAPDTE